MIPVAAKLFLGGLGLAGLVALTSSKTASAAPAKAMPAELVQRMVNALASGNPAAMRALASELRALGYIHEAEQLEAKATEIERQQAQSQPRPPMPKPPATPAAKPPAKPAAATPAPAAGGPVQDGKQLLAARLVREFAKGQAPAATIKAFQLQEGLTADGIYGPKTATALIKYGFVPPTPVSWPKANAEAAKTAYIALLAAQSQRDPVRFEEWRIAMGKIRKGAGPGQFVNPDPKVPLTSQEVANVQGLSYELAMQSARDEMTRR